MKSWRWILVFVTLLMFGFNSGVDMHCSDTSLHTAISQSAGLNENLAGQLNLGDDLRQPSFSLAGNPITSVGRNDSRSANSVRAMLKKHIPTFFRIIIRQDRKFHVGPQSDYGKIAVPSTMCASAVDHYIFGLRHIII